MFIIFVFEILKKLFIIFYNYFKYKEYDYFTK